MRECMSCGLRIQASRHSLERRDFGVESNSVWIDCTGSEDCSKDPLGFHIMSGETYDSSLWDYPIATKATSHLFR